MKRALAYSLLVLIGFTALTARAGGKDDTKLTKTVTRSFSVPDNGHVRIVNKYGPIVVNTWNKDSVKVEIITTAWGKSDKNVEKIMRRVDFDFIQSSRYLELLTVLDRSSGFFTELWNNIGDYSKTLLSQNKLKIEYKVWIPATLDLEIENKFGDVYLTEYSGKLRITLAHGNIRGNKLSELDLDLSFGNADIRNIREATVTLKGTESSFDNLGNATINSSSSELRIRSVSFLKLETKSDRRVVINTAEEVQATSNFSKIEIDDVSDHLRLNMSYGELRMHDLSSGFSNVTITGNNTPIFMSFAAGVAMNLEVQGKESRIVVPSQGLKKQYINDKDDEVVYSGKIGNNPTAEVKVTSANGDIEIKLN